MTKPYFSLLNLFLITSILLSGCATAPNGQLKDTIQTFTSAQRAEKLLAMKQWQLKGKIAFIQKTKNDRDKRDSFSIIWQVNEKKKTQTLNLTSFLGINALLLESNQNNHLIKVDGKEHRGTNLSQLIYSLTGRTLPTEALTFWLKGLPYNNDDNLQIDEITQLPKNLSSFYQNALWQINYSGYKRVNGIQMATKFSIKKDNLLIKVEVKNWSLTD